MSEPGRKSPQATYEDLRRVPSHLRAELIDGELHVAPRPASRHANAASALLMDVRSTFHRKGGGDRPGGWWIVFEPELHLNGQVLVPDVAGWRRERMPEYPDVPAFTQAPDWVAEVTSPSTLNRDRVQKMRIYATEKVGHVWLVDPQQRLVEVFRLEGDKWVLAQTAVGSAPARLEPFEAAELELTYWWGETPDPT